MSQNSSDILFASEELGDTPPNPRAMRRPLGGDPQLLKRVEDKATQGRFFEDFTLGQVIRHATPRTLTSGDVALYTALYGGRFAVQSSAPFAQAIGYTHAPIDDFLVFHTVFGKTVPDISLNAVANLGYADCRFLAPVYAGDTLYAVSEVIGLKENSNGKTGVVYVRSRGFKSDGTLVLEYVRWVMVKKNRLEVQVATHVPDLPAHVSASQLASGLPKLDMAAYDTVLAGSPYRFDDYRIGEQIDHMDGMTVEEAEHMSATRLYQNTARLHFNQYAEGQGRFGRRLIYGGHVISLARALSFNGLANGFHVAAINGGRHVAPLFAGDTVFAWSKVLDKAPLQDRPDLGALRVRLIATKDHPCVLPPVEVQSDGQEVLHANVILDLDYWLILPR